VFDKVHENTRKLVTSRASYSDIVNLSMNQVLMRSINTSLAAVLPVLSLLIVGVKIMGAIALEDFALALLVGLIAGSYSSIFIATPILAMLKRSDSRFKSKTRSTTRPAAAPATARSTASTSKALETPVPSGDAEVATVARPAAAPVAAKPATLTHAPRPRKKRRR
jgi:preprotein translocase subunit SecF